MGNSGMEVANDLFPHNWMEHAQSLVGAAKVAWSPYNDSAFTAFSE